jgi:hypothetical protein
MFEIALVPFSAIALLEEFTNGHGEVVKAQGC